MAGKTLTIDGQKVQHLDGWGSAHGSPSEPWLGYSWAAGWTSDRPWMDHRYRLIDEDGQVTYVAEPYEIDDDDLDDLALLRQDGWQVEIGGEPLWHPLAVPIAITCRPNEVEEQAS